MTTYLDFTEAVMKTIDQALGRVRISQGALRGHNERLRWLEEFEENAAERIRLLEEQVIHLTDQSDGTRQNLDRLSRKSLALKRKVDVLVRSGEAEEEPPHEESPQGLDDSGGSH